MDKETFWHAVQDVDVSDDNEFQEFELLLYAIFRRKIKMRRRHNPLTQESNVVFITEDGRRFKAEFNIDMADSFVKGVDFGPVPIADLRRCIILEIASELLELNLGNDAENSN